MYNGQNSVFWCNLRDTFGEELQTMWQNVRSQGGLSYELVEQYFEDHQNKWPEAIFNEDAYYKYLQPLIDDGDGTYLEMLLGSKAEQRKWWLYNRFRYIDSKYNAGYALTDYIELRGYAKANITVTPYADVYPSVRFGSYLVQTRGTRNTPYTLVCPLDRVNDTEIYIYSASQLADVGDLSGLRVGRANFSNATKLQSIKLGDSSSSYSNGNLTSLSLGNNTLLRTIDVRNCPNLRQAVDLSGCKNIENVYFDGTSITGLSLPNGGILKVLHVPATMTSLMIRNQGAITDFTMPDYSNLSSLWLENVSTAVPVEDIINGLAAGSRVRVIGLNLSVTDYDEAEDFYDMLDTMTGLDEQGLNVDKAQVSGTIHIPSVTGAQVAALNARYANITITYDHITSYVYYYNWEGTTLLHTESVSDGGDAAYSGTPSHSSTAQYDLTFIGWSLQTEQTVANPNAQKAISADRILYAAYSTTLRKFTVRFINEGTTLQTINNVEYGSTVAYTGETPTSSDPDFEFTGWSPSSMVIYAATDFIAQYRDMGTPLIKYLKGTIETYESDSTTDTKLAGYGLAYRTSLTSIEAPATTVETYATRNATALEEVQLTSTNAATIAANAFNGNTKLAHLALHSTTMSTLSATSAFTNTPISAGKGAIYVPTSLISTYKANSNWSNYYIADLNDWKIDDFSTISDSWTEIITAVNDGSYSTKYSVGDTKLISFGGTINVDAYMQIVAMDSDVLSDNSGTAAITWLCKEIIASQKMNSTATTSGGMPSSAMQTYLENTVLVSLPAAVQSAIKEVKKYYYDYDNGEQSYDTYIWIPSAQEIFGGSSYETSGVNYTTVFNSSTARIKYNQSNGATSWWLRSARSATYFRNVINGGSIDDNNATNSYGVVPGFCL